MSGGKLSKQDVRVGLRTLDGWRVVKGHLHRVFEFKDFTQAFGFMKRVAEAQLDRPSAPDGEHGQKAQDLRVIWIGIIASALPLAARCQIPWRGLACPS